MDTRSIVTNNFLNV